MEKKSVHKQIADLYPLLGMLSKEALLEKLIGIVYSEYEDDTLQLFLKLQDLDRLRIKKEKNVLYQGLQSAIGNVSIIAKHLMEDKTSREAKAMAEFIFREDNIAHLINEMKAYFPDGKKHGASNAARWFYNEFVTLLKKTKHLYIEGGDSHEWAKTYNHLEYINLILEINKE